MIPDRAEISVSGRGAWEWLERRVPWPVGSVLRFGHLGLTGGGPDSLHPNRARIEFAVLGPADPANSLEMAQVIIEQLAQLPDAELLAQDSINLRIVRP